MTGHPTTSETAARASLPPANQRLWPAPAGRRNAIAVFAENAGWSAHDWDRLYEFAQQHRPPVGRAAAANLSSWLRNPPDFNVPISPEQVRDLFTRHGMQAGQLLTAIAAGATERFAITFLGPHWIREDYSAAVNGWRRAVILGLDEPAATGWAGTGYLHRDPHGLLPAPGQLLVTDWTDRFGTTAYLWVLAGYTLPEAATMRAAGDLVTGQQLRVMAALNGHILPAGI